ncbi:MAG: hypothetical protein ACPGQM_04445 [Alphaproteobacteria bacterium]
MTAAHALHEIELASLHGIEVGKPRLDWAKLIDRETGMIDFIPDAMAGVAEKRGKVFRGHEKFSGPTESMWMERSWGPKTSSSRRAPSPAACPFRAPIL